MTNLPANSSQASEPVLPRSHRLVRRFATLYGVFMLLFALPMAIARLMPASLGQLRPVLDELTNGGPGALALSALVLAVTALLATMTVTAARVRHAALAERRAGDGHRLKVRDDPGVAARQGQALIIPLGALVICFLPHAHLQATPVGNATAANIVAAFVFAVGFVSLVCERIMNSFPAPQLPEAPALRRLLLLATLLLVAAACIELGRAAGLEWVRWPALMLEWVPLIVAIELALRALARLFLPPPPVATAVAVADSVVAGILTGGPRAPGALLRTHLGLDFARSWALSFLSAAILPALGGTALLCWALSGLKLIDLGQRGVYERFGAPVAVFGPGLHLLMPWPLGRLRPVDYGAIHSVPIGVEQTDAGSEVVPEAEATLPVSLNRLWETSHAGQADYLVPSASTGPQGFQSVSTEISVLYRVGLTDAAALQSVYSVADPEALIKQAASRLVLRYFNSRTLDTVLGASRENIAAALREQLATDMDAHRAGIDVVSVLIEEIHPPAGAAAAYHAVQAAEINANASISNERGRAKRTAGIAEQEAHQLKAAATGTAAEALHGASAESYRFEADRRAHDEGGQAFVMERTFARLQDALKQVPLTILDQRLTASQAPVLDLRAAVGGAGTVRAGGTALQAPAPTTSPAGGSAAPAATTAPPSTPGADEDE